MTGSTVLVSTWSDGLFVIEGGKVRQELAGRGVRGLAAGDDGSVLAIVDTGKLCRRGRDGAWAELAESQSPLSCCLISRGEVFVGTDDGAHLMRLDRDGALRRMEGFDATPDRDKWFAGAMLVDGKMMGPPLGIRSMSASPDGGVLLANVHVGGIPRSTDRGVTWHPTIDIDAGVHQVVCHASRPESVAAAAAAGLCISRDGSASAATAAPRGGSRRMGFTRPIAPPSPSSATMSLFRHRRVLSPRKVRSIAGRPAAQGL
jgi:hypothetical protein